MYRLRLECLAHRIAKISRMRIAGVVMLFSLTRYSCKPGVTIAT